MDIYVYSDESGVFDVLHNDIYVFGGIIFLSKTEKDTQTQKYIGAEKNIRKSENASPNQELKAASLSNKSKSKLFKSLSSCEKFGVIIHQRLLNENIFLSKKAKQRYLDYAYKIAIKRKFQHLINTKKIDPHSVENIYFFIDEHTTATNGRYELRESMLQEFKEGMFTTNYQKFKPPIFPQLKNLTLCFRNSAQTALIRAADIIANRLYFCAKCHTPNLDQTNFNIISLP